MPTTASTRPTSSSHVVAGRAIRRNRAGFAKACTWRRLCPADQPLRHSVGDGGRVAAGLGAFRPDLLEPHGDAFDPLPDERRVAVAEILGADVDDPAGVDHI